VVGVGYWPGPAKLRFRFVAGNLPFVGAPWQEFRVRREGRLVAEMRRSRATALGSIDAVGMPIAEHPPHRSRRARFTHRAPTLGE